MPTKPSRLNLANAITVLRIVLVPVFIWQLMSTPGWVSSERWISLALFIGIVVGTYSTIFIASPLYSLFREKEPKYAAAAAKVLANR